MVDKDLVGEVKNAAHTAIKEMGDAGRFPVIHKPTHIAAMKNLTPQEMDAMVKEFGSDEVMKYLRRLA